MELVRGRGEELTLQILVADDDLMQRSFISSILRKLGHEVSIAADGREAWQALQTNPASVVFTDWMMPNMNGLELIKTIRAASLGRYVYIILCTSKDSRTDAVDGLESGADDFLTKPASLSDIRARLRSGERILQLERGLEEENQKLVSANTSLSQAYERIRKDMRSAAEMQRNLLPSTASIANLRFEWLFCPSSIIGGDIFNFFPLDESHVGFYHLDVSGHGIPSAMLSFTLSKILSPHPLRESPLKEAIANPPKYALLSPDVVASRLNQRFQSDEDMYFTMVYCVFDGESRELRLTQAGHPSPIVIKKGAKAIAVGTGGFPIGALPDREYETTCLALDEGDRLFLFSDGITECTNPAGKQWEMEGLMTFLEESHGTPLKELMQSLEQRLRQWRGSEEFDDDISLLAVEIEH